MKPLQILIVVLFVSKRYSHVKCTTYEPLQIMIVGLFILKRYNHVNCTTYETFADND